MSKKKPAAQTDIKEQLAGAGRSLVRYRMFIFFIVIACLYGFIVWRINALSSAPPTQSDIDSAEQAAAGPKISEAVVRKIESLQDNSVRVQTLFNDARNNPFKE
jgi:hypothetical protein